MTSEAGPPIPPIVCDMTGAPDTAIERIAEYDRLFAQSLIGRQRTDGGIRFRFRAHVGLEDWLRDLAAREKACCAFFTFTVTAQDNEVWWDASVVDDDIARRILDEFYGLPDHAAEGAEALRGRFGDQGLPFLIKEAGTLRPATSAGLPSWPPRQSVILGRDAEGLPERRPPTC
jgi:hypothetical protein